MGETLNSFSFRAMNDVFDVMVVMNTGGKWMMDWTNSEDASNAVFGAKNAIEL